MQREARRGRQAGRVVVNWPTCGAEAPGCTGVQLASFGRCWAHLSPDELRQALSSLAPGKNLDLRGTTLDGSLLGQILSAFRDPHSGELLIGDASLDNARINGKASFQGSVFSGNARFLGAEFSGEANFCGAEFKADAWFNDAKFKDYVDFGNAKFSLTSFKDVEFDNAAQFEDVIFESRTEFNRAKFRLNANFPPYAVHWPSGF
jgi:uncharacterized protein YjbI with pentapeptide repeats